MTKVNFYDSIDDSMLKFAVIIAKHNGKWVFCKHRERSTWEVPGGHREQGEDILETAKRELYEETGAINFEIMEIMLDVPAHIVQFAGIETENVLITQFCWLMIKLRGFFMRSLIWKLLENTGIGKC